MNNRHIPMPFHIKAAFFLNSTFAAMLKIQIQKGVYDNIRRGKKIVSMRNIKFSTL